MKHQYIAAWRIVWIAVLTLLVFSLSPRIALPETSSVSSGGIADMACIPPEDLSPCEPGPPAISGAANTILQVYNECAKAKNDPAWTKKICMLAAIMATGPQGFLIAGSYAVAESADEFLQCTWKGWIEAGEGTKEEKELRKSMVSEIFNAKDVVTIPKDIFEGAPFLNEGSLEAASKVFGGAADAQERLRDFEGFDDSIIRNLSEAYYGIPERVRNYLGDIKTTADECRFELAMVRAGEAKQIMDTYCTSKGTAYRKLQKEIRCYRERNSQLLELQAKDAVSRYGSPQTAKLLKMQEKLDTFRNGMLEDLKLFSSIKQAVEDITARKSKFNAWQAEYKTAGDLALARMRVKDYESVCSTIEPLRTLENQLQSLTQACRSRILEPFGLSLAGDIYENGLLRTNAFIQEKLRGDIAEVQEALKQPCDTGKILELLEKIKTDIDSQNLWAYKEGKCVPVIVDSQQELTAIRETLNERAAADKQIADLLSEAKKRAQSECTFDQAMPDTLEREILGNVAKGCVAEQDIKQQIAEIRRLAKRFEMNANAQERGITALIKKGEDLLNSSDPSCRLGEARQTLNDADERFRQRLDCEASNPAPSQTVRDRAARVHALLENAQQFLEKRTAEVKQAELKYQEVVERILAGTDDICNYKAALSDENVNTLSKFAKESCQAEKMSYDLGSVKDAILKLDKRIDDDLAKMARALEEIRKESDCSSAESTLKKIKEQTEYFAECEGYKATVSTALQAMTDAIQEKKVNAERVVNQTVAEAEGNYRQCRNIDTTADDALDVKNKVPISCIGADALKRLEIISGKLKKLSEDMRSRATRILELCQNTEKPIARCEWSVVEEKIAEARRMFPGEPCFSSEPVFTDLSQRVESVESNEKSQKDAMDRRRAGIFYKIEIAKAHIAKSRQMQGYPQRQFEGYKENIGPVEDVKKEIESSQELSACLSDLLPDITAVLADAAKKAEPPATAGEGGAQRDVGSAAPDRQADGGATATGPGGSSPIETGAPLTYKPSIVGTTFPLGEMPIQPLGQPPAFNRPQTETDKPSDGFTDLGGTTRKDPSKIAAAVPPEGFSDLGGTTRQDPTTSRARADASGSSFILNTASSSISVRPVSVGPQPAASHIYSACSRLGWAGGLCRYSAGPADQSIIDHLITSGEHVMWANRESYASIKAWPSWSSTKGDFRSWSDELIRKRSSAYRQSLADRIQSTHFNLADQLSYQSVGTPEKHQNCDAYYCRIGFELAYGMQALGIADEAFRNGDEEAMNKSRGDGLNHLQNASRILMDYVRVPVASGRCADLSGIKEMLANVMSGNSISNQVLSASGVWKLVAERINQLSSGGVIQRTAQEPQAAIKLSQTRQPLQHPNSVSSQARPRTDGYYATKTVRTIYFYFRFFDNGVVRSAAVCPPFLQATYNPATKDYDATIFPPSNYEKSAINALIKPMRFHGDGETLDQEYQQSDDMLILEMKNLTIRHNRTLDTVTLRVVDNGNRIVGSVRPKPGYSSLEKNKHYTELDLVFVPYDWRQVPSQAPVINQTPASQNPDSTNSENPGKIIGTWYGVRTAQGEGSILTISKQGDTYIGMNQHKKGTGSGWPRDGQVCFEVKFRSKDTNGTIYFKGRDYAYDQWREFLPAYYIDYKSKEEIFCVMADNSGGCNESYKRHPW